MYLVSFCFCVLVSFCIPMDRVSFFFRFCLLLIALIGSIGCRAIGRMSESRQSISARRLSRAGMEAMREGQWNTAEDLFTSALEVSVADDRAHRGLAESLWQRQERDAAVKHMEQAVRLSAGDPKLIQRLGRMYLEVGRLDDADRQSMLALEADRHSAEVWALRGDCLATRNRPKDALAAYHRALALQPEFPSVQLQAAEIYREQERYDRLLATLERLQDSRGDESELARVQLLKGIAMRQLGNSDEAYRCFASAIEKDPSDPSALLHAASVCLERGDVARAKHQIDTAMKLDPDSNTTGSLIEQLRAEQDRLAIESGTLGNADSEYR